MFSVTVLPIVENYVIDESALDYAKRFISRELYVENEYTKSKFTEEPDYPVEMYQDFVKLTGVTLEWKEFQRLIKKSNLFQSINPTFEVDAALDRIPEHTPQNAAMIFVLYNNVIVASIISLVDPRTTFQGETVGYFIGIRKSFPMVAAQAYLSGSDSPLVNVRISELLVPAVEEYAKAHHAGYLIVSPIGPMKKILQEFFGFVPSPNLMNSTYEPPVYMMVVAWEPIHWKKI